MKTLVFDTETTGVTKHPQAKDAVQPRIIEFAGVIVDERCEVVSEYSTLIDPGEEITEEITKITGITNEMIEGAARIKDHFSEIQALFDECELRCAHNLPFDDTLVALEADRLQIGWRPKSRGICTVQEYFPLYGRRPRLKELHPAFTGKSWEQNHRALDDVKALVEVLQQSGVIDRYNRRMR